MEITWALPVDPIGGFVQIPLYLERQLHGAIKSHQCAEWHWIPTRQAKKFRLDKVVNTMWGKPLRI